MSAFLKNNLNNAIKIKDFKEIEKSLINLYKDSPPGEVTEIIEGIIRSGIINENLFLNKKPAPKKFIDFTILYILAHAPEKSAVYEYRKGLWKYYFDSLNKQQTEISINPLKGIKTVNELWIRNTAPITNIDFLKGLTSVKSLELIGLKNLADISGLAGSKKFVSLGLPGVKNWRMFPY